VNYEEALLGLKREPSLAAFVRDGVGRVAVGPARALHSFSDLDYPGRWFVVLPYAFPKDPGRAWNLAHATACGTPNAERRTPNAVSRTPHAIRTTPSWSADGHLARVRATQESIAAGDLYELNLACTWAIDLAPHPHPDLALHLALLRADPAAFACVARGGDGPAIVGNSPELFLSVQDGIAECRPIKGTRRRIPGREAAVRAELDGSAKERAELAMIVDLMRHDLGRVAEPGGVRVADPGSVIDLPRLHHRAATVTARLRPATPLSAVLAACFPAGSITGAPKLAAMRRLAELEGSSRGHWCGAYGTLGEGACELAVAIRTVEIDGSHLTLRAGGGIVADSDPAAEWDEARAKAQGIAAVLGAEV
jgi:anthranilate/para-aminobenzoate synthase component I